jgi:peptidyl-prolyl cis-trans isomerase C/foldase protein PrsA
MTLSRSLPSFLVVAFVAALAACPADPRDSKKSQVVARVGTSEIMESELLAVLAQRGTARIADPVARSTVARAMLDEMITERLMLLAAEEAGITVRDDEVDRELRSRADDYPPGTFQRLLVAEQLTLTEFREKVRRRLVQEAYLRARLASEAGITEQEVRARFEQSAKDHPVGEQVRARQILVKTSEEATHILEQLRARKIGFEAAAQKYSTSPDAEQGGDLGWFSKGDMPDDFDVCFNLEKGTISDVVISDYGFHLFQIVDRREAHVETFESARDRIEQEILRERQDQAYEKLLVELRQQTPVTINDALVDRVVSLLPPPPATPSEQVRDDTGSRALDSLPSAIDPVPPVPGKERAD